MSWYVYTHPALEQQPLKFRTKQKAEDFARVFTRTQGHTANPQNPKREHYMEWGWWNPYERPVTRTFNNDGSPNPYKQVTP